MSSNIYSSNINHAPCDLTIDGLNHQSLRKNRVEVVDVARGLSVIVMIMVHTLWMYGSQATQTEALIGDLLHLLGKGTAAFLVLMGFSMALSSKNTSFGLIVRGTVLLAIAYALNFLKFIVPIVVFKTMPESFIQAYQWQSPLNSEQYVYLLLTGDILQMAGLSLILLGVMNKFLTNNVMVVALAVFIVSFSGELRGTAFGITSLDYIASLFWSDNYQVYFPVFPWMACILFGRLFGNLFLQWQHDQRNTFKVMAITGAGLMVCGVSLMLIDMEYHFNNFFHLGPGGALYLIGINGVGIWLLYHLVNILPNNKISQLLCWCSKRVTSLYVLQWVLICWGMGLFGFQKMLQGQLSLMLTAVVLWTLLTHLLFEKMIKRKYKWVDFRKLTSLQRKNSNA